MLQDSHLKNGKDIILNMINKLDRAERPWIWYIFTDDVNVIKHPNVIYMKPRLDIYKFIQKADYLVQLSKNERILL